MFLLALLDLHFVPPGSQIYTSAIRYGHQEALQPTVPPRFQWSQPVLPSIQCGSSHGDAKHSFFKNITYWRSKDQSHQTTTPLKCGNLCGQHLSGRLVYFGVGSCDGLGGMRGINTQNFCSNDMFTHVQTMMWVSFCFCLFVCLLLQQRALGSMIFHLAVAYKHSFRFGGMVFANCTRDAEYKNKISGM